VFGLFFENQAENRNQLSKMGYLLGLAGVGTNNLQKRFNSLLSTSSKNKNPRRIATAGIFYGKTVSTDYPMATRLNSVTVMPLLVLSNNLAMVMEGSFTN